MNSNLQSVNTQNRNIKQWVEYIQTLHHREIELSLERVREVYARLYPQGLSCKIISISGTNGKGSTAELCASIYRQAGFKVGKFTSPHLVNFNERINVGGSPIDDQRLLASFVRIEAVRDQIPITFFEFGTLLAIDLFARANVDIAVMEIGLGGRLDSVNILDADVAITTSVALDHTSWLGDSIEKIAFEKAGIARPQKPYIVGIAEPAKSLLAHADTIDASLQLIGREFSIECGDDSWNWRSSSGKRYLELPSPFNQMGVQLSNCALALQAVEQLQPSLIVSEEHIREGIQQAKLAGRCQIVQQRPLMVFDVSHNEASVARLAEFLRLKMSKKNDNSKIIAVCGMLKDKEITVSLEQLSHDIDQWHVASIHNERGASSADIEECLKEITEASIACYDSVELAYNDAISTLTGDDCLVVFGSFHIVGDILAHLNKAIAT